MALVPSPGVALARISGTMGVNPWAIVLHWYAGVSSAWTQSQINALNQSIQSRWPTTMSSLFPVPVVVTQLAAADLTDATDRSNILANLNIPGTGTGSLLSNASCVMINYKINSRFRGGHPRTYLPSPATTQTTNGDTWTTAYVTSINNAWQTFTSGIKTDMQAAGLANNSQCCPRYSYTYTDNPAKHKWEKTKSGFLGPFPVVSFSVSSQIRSQRRRLGP